MNSARSYFTLLLMLLSTVSAIAQEEEDQRPLEKLRARRLDRLQRRGDLVTRDEYEGVLSGLDFIKPFARTEFRYRYRQLTSKSQTSFFISRYDIPYRLKNDWILSSSFEAPLVKTDVVSRDNPNGNNTFGAGDLGTRFLMVGPQKDRWSFAAGAQFFWPTASQDQMGFGKYLAAPMIGVSYHPKSWKPGSFCGLLLADIFDYAGKDSRRDIHELSIQPIANIYLGDEWFVTSASDIRINWEQDSDVFLPANLSIGKVIDVDKFISVGATTAIVDDYDLYDWQIDVRIAYFF